MGFWPIMEVVHISCNTGTLDCPDMYSHSPQALSIHIRQIPCAHVTVISTKPASIIQLTAVSL